MRGDREAVRAAGAGVERRRRHLGRLVVDRQRAFYAKAMVWHRGDVDREPLRRRRRRHRPRRRWGHGGRAVLAGATAVRLNVRHMVAAVGARNQYTVPATGGRLDGGLERVHVVDAAAHERRPLGGRQAFQHQNQRILLALKVCAIHHPDGQRPCLRKIRCREPWYAT